MPEVLAYEGIDLVTLHDRYFRYFLDHPTKDDSIIGGRYIMGMQPVRFHCNYTRRSIPNFMIKQKPIGPPNPDFLKMEKTIPKACRVLKEEAREIVLLEAEIRYFRNDKKLVSL